MAFADPQSVTINAVANPLPRVSSGDYKGAFQKDDATVRLSMSHSFPKGKTRRLVQLEHFKVASDPLMANQSVRVGMKAYLVVETPEVGYTLTEAKQIVDALTAYLTASSGARTTQLLGGES